MSGVKIPDFTFPTLPTVIREGLSDDWRANRSAANLFTFVRIPPVAVTFVECSVFVFAATREDEIDRRFPLIANAFGTVNPELEPFI